MTVNAQKQMRSAGGDRSANFREPDVGGHLPGMTAADPDDSAETRLLKHEVARYIVQMTNELGGMARGANMDLLAYFLDMSRVEANVQLQRNED